MHQPRAYPTIESTLKEVARSAGEAAASAVQGVRAQFTGRDPKIAEELFACGNAISKATRNDDAVQLWHARMLSLRQDPVLASKASQAFLTAAKRFESNAGHAAAAVTAVDRLLLRAGVEDLDIQRVLLDLVPIAAHLAKSRKEFSAFLEHMDARGHSNMWAHYVTGWILLFYDGGVVQSLDVFAKYIDFMSMFTAEMRPAYAMLSNDLLSIGSKQYEASIRKDASRGKASKASEKRIVDAIAFATAFAKGLSKGIVDLKSMGRITSLEQLSMIQELLTGFEAKKEEIILNLNKTFRQPPRGEDGFDDKGKK